MIKNSINDSVSKIEECVNDGGEWGIDVVGGSEMLLLSAGIVYGKHDNITLFRVDPVSGAARFIDKSVTDSLDPLVFTSQMRKYPKKLRLENTVEENVLLHGGAVILVFVADKNRIKACQLESTGLLQLLMG